MAVGALAGAKTGKEGMVQLNPVTVDMILSLMRDFGREAEVKDLLRAYMGEPSDENRKAALEAFESDLDENRKRRIRTSLERLLEDK